MYLITNLFILKYDFSNRFDSPNICFQFIIINPRNSPQIVAVLGGTGDETGLMQRFQGVWTSLHALFTYCLSIPLVLVNTPHLFLLGFSKSPVTVVPTSLTPCTLHIAVELFMECRLEIPPLIKIL